MRTKTLLLAAGILLSALAGLAARKVTNKDFDEAVKAFNEEHYESALALFNKVVAQKPENGYAWAFIASIKQEGKMTDEALEAAQKAIQAIPASDSSFLAWTHSELARIYVSRLDTTAALEELTTSINLAPDDPDFRAYRGNLHQKHGDWEEAEADFKYIIKHNPNTIDGLLGLGSVQGAQDKHDEAIATFTQAITIDPNDADAYGYRAVEFYNTKRYGEALNDAIQALSIQEDNKHALWLLPFISNQDATMVIDSLEEKRKSDPSRSDYWEKILQRITSAPATPGRY